MDLARVAAGVQCTFCLWRLEEEEMLILELMKRRHKRWMLPYLEARTDMGQRNTFSKLHRHIIELDIPDEFRITLRMDVDLYSELLSKIYPLVYRKDTNYRLSIKPEERLDITLRYLAHGDCPRTLNQGNLVGNSTVLPLIRDTCAAIYSVLRKDYMSVPQTEGEWLDIAADFRKHWQLPHCIGAIDGKHVRVRKPKKSGSLYFNYKKYYSVVLLAVVSARYEFLYVDIGSEGRSGDSRIWKESPLFADFNSQENPLHVPPPSKVVGIREQLPYYMVGDDAFGLATNMMKPYALRDQGDEEIGHNYRISRGRRVVENGFGILATRFRLFLREQDMEPAGVQVVVLAACALHNYLRRRSGQMYLPPGTVDWEDKDHVVHPGEWRTEGSLDGLDKSGHDRNTFQSAKHMRDSLCKFFNSRRGKLPWQDRYLRKKKADALTRREQEFPSDESEMDDE